GESPREMLVQKKPLRAGSTSVLFPDLCPAKIQPQTNQKKQSTFRPGHRSTFPGGRCRHVQWLGSAPYALPPPACTSEQRRWAGQPAAGNHPVLGPSAGIADEQDY